MDSVTELEISLFLLRRLLGVKTEDKKQTKVTKLVKNELLLINIGSTSTGGRVLSVKADLAKIQLTSPACTEVGEKVALSRRIEKHWRLVGENLYIFRGKGRTLTPTIKAGVAYNAAPCSMSTKSRNGLQIYHLSHCLIPCYDIPCSDIEALYLSICYFHSCIHCSTCNDTHMHAFITIQQSFARKTHVPNQTRV